MSVCHFVHSIQTAEDIVKLLCRPDSPITLVFLTPSAGTQFQGESHQWERKIEGGLENFAIFDRNRRISRKRYEIGPWLLWNVNRNS